MKEGFMRKSILRGVANNWDKKRIPRFIGKVLPRRGVRNILVGHPTEEQPSLWGGGKNSSPQNLRGLPDKKRDLGHL